MATIEGLKINIDSVEAAAGKIESTNQQLTQKLEEINNYMKTLGDASVWISDAESAIMEKYNALYPKFSDFDTVIKAYVDYLRNRVVETYRTNETTLTNNASNVSQFA